MFFEGNEVSVSTTGYGKPSIYQGAPVIDRLSSLAETGHYKALITGQVHYLRRLGPQGLTAFNFRCLCERCCEDIKLKLVISLSDSFD